MNKRPLTHCPIALASNILGDRWTLLILRDLLSDDVCRFQELQKSLTGIAATTLSARLKALEDQGIVERQFYSDHPPRAEYLLTPKGKAIGPIMSEIYRFGSKYGASKQSG